MQRRRTNIASLANKLHTNRPLTVDFWILFQEWWYQKTLRVKCCIFCTSLRGDVLDFKNFLLFVPGKLEILKEIATGSPFISFIFSCFAQPSRMTVLKGCLIPSRITEAQICHPLSHLLLCITFGPSRMTVLKGCLIPSRITEAQSCHPLSHLLLCITFGPLYVALQSPVPF